MSGKAKQIFQLPQTQLRISRQKQLRMRHILKFHIIISSYYFKNILLHAKAFFQDLSSAISYYQHSSVIKAIGYHTQLKNMMIMTKHTNDDAVVLCYLVKAFR